MSSTLTKSETTLLLAAAEHPRGLILPPRHLKPASRERLLGRLLRDGLAEVDGEEHRIAPAGYKALGLRPPRKAKAAAPGASSEGAATGEAGAARAGTKLALVRELLGRPDCATLAELVDATGWLPHTTRAVLSRMRSAGQPLIRGPRPDGTAAYRSESASPVAAEPAPETTARPGPARAGRSGGRKAEVMRAAA